MEEPIERIIIAEDKIKANLKRNICPECGRIYFITVAQDGSVVEPCPVCLGLFDDETKDRTKKIWEEDKKIAEDLAQAYYDSIIDGYKEQMKKDSKENFGYNTFADGITLGLDVVFPLLDEETIVKVKNKINELLRVRKRKNKHRS